MNDNTIPHSSSKRWCTHIAAIFAAGGALALALANPPVFQLLLLGAFTICCLRKISQYRARKVEGVLAVEAAAAIAGRDVSSIRHARERREVA